MPGCESELTFRLSPITLEIDRSVALRDLHEPATVRTTSPGEEALPLPDLSVAAFRWGRPDVA